MSGQVGGDLGGSAGRDPGWLLAVAVVFALGALLAASPAAAAPPAKLVAPSVSGSPEVGHPLTCSPGEWSGEPQFSYSWVAATEDTTPTYTPVAADVLHPVRCEVTATNAEGSTNLSSYPTTVLPAHLGYCEGNERRIEAFGSLDPVLDDWASAFESETCPGSASKIHPEIHGFLLSETEELELLAFWEIAALDQAPDPAEMKVALRREPATQKLAVIPAAQSSVAIIANPPPGCAVGAITNHDLDQVMRGNIFNWSGLSTAHGECDSRLRRVVPVEATGVGTRLKEYLAVINPNPLPCMPREMSWEETTLGQEGQANTDWPTSCAATPLTRLIRADYSYGRGRTEVETVRETPGAVGFASLPVAMEFGGDPLELQNNGWKPAAEATFASPIRAGRSNCEGASYTVPLAGRAAPLASPTNVDWSAVRSDRPAVGGTAYPLCMLGYMLGLTKGEYLSQTHPTERNFLQNYLLFDGQQALREENASYLSPLPRSADPAHDVLGAARLAVAAIER
jgi:ABC-type phosphate transport system substrate-binding protein